MATIVPVVRKCGNGWNAIIRKAGHKAIKRTFDLKADAQRWAAEQEGLILAKRYKDPRLANLVKLVDALEKYREEGFIEKKADSTVDREIYSRRHLERLLGEDTSLSDINASVVNEYQKKRLQEVTIVGASRKRKIKRWTNNSPLYPSRHSPYSSISSINGRVDIWIIADILGHSTLQMAMRYTHTFDSHKQDVVDKISYWVKRQREMNNSDL